MYFLIKFIFYIIFLINSILCYDPPPRTYHNSVIINDRLIIIGGDKPVTEVPGGTYELIYLDLSKSFDNTNLSWNLVHEGDLPISTWSSTAIVSLDNSTIFLIGGMFDKNTHDYVSNPVYTYNYLNSKWTKPSITGDSVPIRQRMTGVIDDSGIIYIFGGYNFTTFGEVYNEMNTLDTSSMTWKTLSIINNLPPLSNGYSASILPNGIIVYFGGLDGNVTLAPMKNVSNNLSIIFNSKNATGNDVDSRWLFASVLTPDGHIIIFGGCDLNYISVSPKLAILNTNKSPYEWSIPSSSEINSPPSIYGHTANLYYNYMIITFGYDADTNYVIYNSTVYLYDITNNTWVTRFNPPPPPSPSPSPSTPTSTPSPHSPKFLKPLLIGLGAIGVLICIAIFVFYKKRNEILKIAGSN
ncbi:hypothetical protein Glove_262g60 [Diversispora epigaea]|uniref:Galactose oxidase n=1 Tax=Diversispora epigaea TaxID=1348612 RepID=A0A397ID61_9GLOM|nr:hypothetical protein Glove_262g60 [Diversispora epigaea]